MIPAVSLGCQQPPTPVEPEPPAETCRADLDALPHLTGPKATEWTSDVVRAQDDPDYLAAVVEFVGRWIPGGSPADAEVIGDGTTRVLTTTTRFDPHGNIGRRLRRAVQLPEGTQLP